MKGKPQTIPTDEDIQTAVLDIVARRGLESSACPSEVARQLQADNWHALMPRVREVAARLALDGKIRVTQRGVVLPPTRPWTGPIRLRLVPINFQP